MDSPPVADTRLDPPAPTRLAQECVGGGSPAFLAKPNRADLRFLTDLIEADKLRPVIDRAYSLSEVPEAIRYLEDGHVRGKVVITV